MLVDLAPVVDDAGVADAALTALGFSQLRGESPTEALERELQGADLLMMLDNCEHVIGGCARLAECCCRGAPGVRLLGTSRERLRIDGETVWLVPPLGSDASIELFVSRARAAAAATTLASTEVETIGVMCRRLEGIPLAIELAAVRVPRARRRSGCRAGHRSIGLTIPRE